MSEHESHSDAAPLQRHDSVSVAGRDEDRGKTARPSLGAHLLGDRRCLFRVWAPLHDRVELHIVSPRDQRIAMQRGDDGYHEVTVDDCGEGTRYFFTVGGTDRPDPASRFQPDGPHEASAVVGDDFEWEDADWRGIPLEEHVIYELHVGTFTDEGRFDAITGRLDQLKELGVTAIELLPVAQFPGARNWGYDGTYVGAVQNSYGGPRALKQLVNECHKRGLAILLDVVYNHLGPEGNYLAEFGPYFTDRYRTPWGLALNFDGPSSDDVRWYFIHNALQWVDEFHFDGLRVDAVHAIVDHSAEPFLQDLTTAVRERAERLGRRIHRIAESDLNDPRVITPPEDLGLGFDSQWADDYHHTLHVLLTGERDGYYAGFEGKVSELARIFNTGYLYVGQHSTYRGRKYGLRPRTSDGRKFVVSVQNHDQVGNRMLGERLAAIVPVEKVRLAAAALVFSPFIPMLFMGEEYGETRPFQYFTSHSDPGLIEAVRKGRREEFDDFTWKGEPPDPDDEATFLRSRLDWRASERDEQGIRKLFMELLRIRRETPALRTLDLEGVTSQADDENAVLTVLRISGSSRALTAFNFSGEPQNTPLHGSSWRVLLENGASIQNGELTLEPYGFGVWSAEA